MNNENQIGTLEEMTEESFLKRPHQATEAIEEYLLNLKEENPEKEVLLNTKLTKDAKYLNQFKVAITHTSLMIFLMSIKAASIANAAVQSDELEQDEVQEVISQIQIDFDKYVREFSMFARQDDKDIYDMRLYYIDGLTGEQLGLDKINPDMYESKSERAIAEKRAEVQRAKYDELRVALQKQYKETKIHFQ
jgi:hypothetical protein